MYSKKMIKMTRVHYQPIKDTPVFKNQPESIQIISQAENEIFLPFSKFFVENTNEGIVYCKLISENEKPADFIFFRNQSGI